MKIYKDKICIVTGAASGIGKALCEELAEHGAKVIATDINMKMLTETVNGIVRKGGRANAAELDVTDYDAFKKLIDDTVLHESRLDYIFNNAGIVIIGEVRDQKIDDWRKVLNVNLNGVIYGSILAYQLMAKQGFGHIVNLSSIEGLIAFPLTVPYVVAKFGVMGLSKGLFVEGTDLGVKVSVVCPGFVRTPIFESPTVNIKMEEALKAMKIWDMLGISPEGCAHVILKGVSKNKPIIPVTFMAKLMWVLARIRPKLVMNFARKDFKRWRNKARIHQ